MIQIIDVSDKMLYNEIKAEQSYLNLINATLSHELRNPLSALLNSREQIIDILGALKETIEELKSEIKSTNKIQLIYNDLEQCTNKMFTASKFIDYFVNDMLDYSVLNRDSESFNTNIGTFDIRNAIEEMIDVQQDKIDMKTIDVEKTFKGFENFDLKSDMRRI